MLMLAPVAGPVDLDRTAAIRAAIESGAAVTDSGDPEGRDRMRFWFVRDHGHGNPAASWHDEDGDAYELEDLPYALVVAVDQTAPAWREGLAERLTTLGA